MVTTAPTTGPALEARTATGRRVALSVVVPVYDEEACIGLLWARLHAVLRGLDLPWEAIFVDDGSRDGSRARLADLDSDTGDVRVIALDRHAGQTAALDAGFRSARGEWILTLDADLQNPPEEIPRLLAAANGVDLVYGRRRRRSDGWSKRVASRIGNGVRNAITGHHVNDTGCTLKLYRAAALRRIPLLSGMHRFLPTLFAFHGFRIREIDVGHEARVAGTSKYGNLSRAARGLIDCVAVRWMRARTLTWRSEEVGDEPGGDAL